MTDVTSAEIEAARAREKLGVTLSQLQHRLNPKTLVSEVGETVREQAADISGRSIAAVKARPLATAAVVLPLIGFFFRHPIARGVNSVLGRDDAEQSNHPTTTSRSSV